MKRDFDHRNLIGAGATRTCRLQQNLARDRVTDHAGQAIVPPSIVLATGTAGPVLREFLMRDSRFRSHDSMEVSANMQLARTRVGVLPLNAKDQAKMSETVTTLSSVRRHLRRDAVSAGVPCRPSVDVVFVPRTTEGANLELKLIQDFYSQRANEQHGWKKTDPSPATTSIHGKQEPAIKKDLANIITAGTLDIVVTTETLTHGIDFANVSLVLGWMQGSLAKFCQSIGRAGRGDGIWDPAGLALHNPTRMQQLLYEAAWVAFAAEQSAEGRSAGADLSEEAVLHVHAKGRLNDLRECHTFLTNHWDCRAVQIHGALLPAGVTEPKPCREDTTASRPRCDTCQRALEPRGEHHWTSVEVTRETMVAVLLAHDALDAEDRNFDDLCKSVKDALKASLVEAVAANPSQEKAIRRNAGAKSFTEKFTVWLVDGLVGCNVLVPRLSAKLVPAPKDARPAAAATAATNQPGKETVKVKTGGSLARIAGAGGAEDRVLLNDNCALLCDLDLPCLSPSADKIGRPCTRRNRVVNALHPDGGHPFQLARPVWPRTVTPKDKEPKKKAKGKKTK